MPTNMKYCAPPKNPLKGLVPVALDAAAAASLTLSGTRSLAPFAASLTLAAASDGLLGATSSTLSLAAAHPHAHLVTILHFNV